MYPSFLSQNLFYCSKSTCTCLCVFWIYWFMPIHHQRYAKGRNGIWFLLSVVFPVDHIKLTPETTHINRVLSVGQPLLLVIYNRPPISVDLFSVVPITPTQWLSENINICLYYFKREKTHTHVPFIVVCCYNCSIFLISYCLSLTLPNM